MPSIAQTVWNAIAKGQPLSKPWSIVFNMAPEQLQQGLQEWVDQPIRATGADEPTLLAYRRVAPLLVEHAAISAYIAQQQDSRLRAALPEITCVGDAVMFAMAEYQLTPSQQLKLKKLLITALKG